ncbi:MAG: hypothetical protein P4L39_03050 [Humidesulfovibrio sp.]|nr:hypothetical protein [Humidesulfovibrio sp.]
MRRRHLALCWAVLPWALGVASQAPAGQPAAPAHVDCRQLQELYIACHHLGLQADSVQTCEEAAGDLLLFPLDQRAETQGGKRSGVGQALAGLVCSTGCEDAVSGQPPATAQEIAEAFCDQAPASRVQGGSPQ